MMKAIEFIPFREHRIEIFDQGTIYAREYENNGPPVFLMHGFPDNIHLYDYLIPELTENFHVIVFDFLGWHMSSKPAVYNYTADDQLNELQSVVDYFGLDEIWLVAHDASGPPAINYALNFTQKVSRLVLLNTYYGRMKEVRKPEAIWMFSTPFARIIAGWIARNLLIINRTLYFWQVGSFIGDEQKRKILVPKLFRPFSEPANFKAFLKLNKDLDAALYRNSKRENEFYKLSGKVLIVFGEDDPYLNTKVAQKFQSVLPGSILHIIKKASHYVQVDQPGEVAYQMISNRKH